MEEFEEFLSKKKIDSPAFKKEEPEKWQEFKVLFDQVHPDSFTAQKLFLINAIRRSFPLSETSSEETKPMVRPKPKIKVPVRRPKQD